VLVVGGTLFEIDIKNWPLLLLLINVKLPVPDVFENVIGMPINITASFSAYRSAIVRCIIQHHYIRGSKFELHEHLFQ